MNNYLKKVKILFFVIILLLMVSIASGGFVMKNSSFLTGKQLSQIISYLNYKSSFAYADNKNLAALIISIFNNDDSAVENKNAAKSIPVLLYHGIVDNPDGSNVLLEDFKNQMFALKKAGWQTITLEDFYAFMRGEKELPDKSFLLTFDDGRKDSYYPVDPILKALDYNAVMFVITKYSLEEKSGNYYLSKKELEPMIKNGRWEIGAHTREGHNTYKISSDGKEGHFYSNKLWLDDKNRLETDEEFISRIKSDLTVAKNDIEQRLGINVISFSYPFGDFGQNSINFPEAESIVTDIVKSVYPLSFYQVWLGKGFSFNYQNENDYLIKRIEVRPDWNADNLLKILDVGKEKILPYADNFEDYNGWIKTWGLLSLNNNSIVLSSHTFTTGSAVFLDGAYLWQNYIFKADVYLVKGQVFSLTARYKDGNNYVACSFSDKSIKVEQVLDGERKVLSEWKDDFVFIGRDRKAGVKVYDNAISCYLDDKIVLKSYNLDKGLNHGGIGFKTWDPQMDNSELIIKNVFVEEIK